MNKYSAILGVCFAWVCTGQQTVLMGMTEYIWRVTKALTIKSALELRDSSLQVGDARTYKQVQDASRSIQTETGKCCNLHTSKSASSVTTGYTISAITAANSMQHSMRKKHSPTPTAFASRLLALPVPLSETLRERGTIHQARRNAKLPTAQRAAKCPNLIFCPVAAQFRVIQSAVLHSLLFGAKRKSCGGWAKGTDDRFPRTIRVGDCVGRCGWSVEIHACVSKHNHNSSRESVQQ